MKDEIEREKLERMLMLLAVATFHTPALQAERTELVEAGLKALAAPVQEPVAIALNTGTKQGVKWLKNVEHGESLYTTPPAAQQQWTGLTEDEIEECASYGYRYDVVAVTEDKLKEKNSD